MKHTTRILLGRLSAVAAISILSGVAVNMESALAANESFFAGKTVKVIIRSGPGGGNDFYGRIIARHIGKHIPGKPNTIAINMPGAGGMVAANYLYNRAKRDGTEIAILARDIASVERIGATGLNYKTMELISLGSTTSDAFVWVIAGKHPVNNLPDLRRFNGILKFAGTGEGTGSVQFVRMLASDGLPVTAISGYSGTSEKVQAILRGEVQGTTGSYGALKPAMKEEGLKVIGKLGNHPDLTAVDDVRKHLKSGDVRATASFMAAPFVAGRPFFTAPRVPANRVKILRMAFKATLEDPTLLEEARRARRDISYTDPEEMAATYKEALNAPDKVIAAFKKPTALVTHKGKVTKTARGGRLVSIDYKGKEVSARISGSRTKVTIKGRDDKRKNIKVGMTCGFTYPKPGAEAKTVACD